jgi:hypothetical protein
MIGCGPVTFELAVCFDCYEPVPGFDPDDEASEAAIRQRLLVLALALLRHEPRLDLLVRGESFGMSPESVGSTSAGEETGGCETTDSED